MNINAIVYKALEQLREKTGLAGYWKPGKGAQDGQLEFKLTGRKLVFHGEVKKELRDYHLPLLRKTAVRHKNIMVVAENIFPGLKELLRKDNIGYLDTAGNIYIKTTGQYIWIDGNKATQEKKEGTNRAFTKTGLKIVFQLLVENTAINMAYRHLADRASVALGTVKNTIEGLRDAGFILQVDSKIIMLQKKRELLDRWVTGYGELLKPTLRLGAYTFWKQGTVRRWKELELKGGEGYWGGEPAGEDLTGYLQPKILTLYTENHVPLMKRWTLIPAHTGEIQLYTKFWKVGGEYHHKIVPPVLAYADLVLTGDPRCIETADKVYKQFLKDEFEGN